MKYDLKQLVASTYAASYVVAREDTEFKSMGFHLLGIYTQAQEDDQVKLFEESFIEPGRELYEILKEIYEEK